MKHGIPVFALALTLAAQQSDQTRISVDVTRVNLLFTVIGQERAASSRT